MKFGDFCKVSNYHWVLPSGKNTSMRVNAEIFASEEILKNALEDNSIQQVINVASLPTILSPSIAMPDIHYGYGFCIGGVAAFPAESGIVLPGGVGYDINCGVRLIASKINVEDMATQGEKLGYSILNRIPTGLTKKSTLKLTGKEFMRILESGAEEIVNHYGGSKEDLEFIESAGKLPFYSPEVISDRALERGKSQVGSLGAGNHFLEIQYVDEIFDKEAARVYGLEQGKVTIMIHTGSRGFGHQVASDYIERIRKRNLHKIKVKDPQLIYAPLGSKEGDAYLQALNAASNFAWANRHLLMERIVEIFEEIFTSSRRDLGLRLVYDQAHNIAKFENHMIKGKEEKVLVHRKGATRAFPPEHPEIPHIYQKTGQPVLIPGSMGTSSFVLKGSQKAMELSLGSSAHGAGRRLSRHKAIKYATGMDVAEKLRKKNILVFSNSLRGLQEEIPEAYKEIDHVIEVTDGAGLSEKVARLIPLVVVKG